MNRAYWNDIGSFLPGESSVAQVGGVRLYDGEDRVRYYFACVCHHVLLRSLIQTEFDSGTLQLTTHRLLWDDDEQEVGVVTTPLIDITIL